MKVLVACEFSGIVRDAFIAHGHDAISCDLLPTERPGPHYQGDVLNLLSEPWDMIVAFPPCTHLSSSGAQYWKQKQADGRQQEAIDFVMAIWQADAPFIAIENPTGILSTVFSKPTQVINPFQFGEPYTKRTCLWLKNLPPLIPTNVVEPKYRWTSNSYHGGLKKDGTRTRSKLPVQKPWDTGHERSKSFQGIADAMAEQWGRL